MGYPVSKPPPAPAWFEGKEGSPSYWHAVTMEEKRQRLENERSDKRLEDRWNLRQDRKSYLWQIVATIGTGLALASVFL